MKSLLFVFLIIILQFACIFSRQVNISEINSVANNFLELQSRLRKISKPEIIKIQTLKKSSSEHVIATIVNLNPEGFLVVTNDTDYPPIIAYSFNHGWNSDTSSNNILYHLLIKDVQWRRESLLKIPSESIKKANRKWDIYLSKINKQNMLYSFKQWPEMETTLTGGWVETTWHQRSPYNDFCPMDPDTNIRCAVGCVATAFAQIVHYHKYIGDLRFVPEDRYTALYSIHVSIDGDSTQLDFPSFNRLNGYLDSLKYKYQNSIELTNSDLAALNFACGICAGMGYHYNGSGASGNISRELINKMHYLSAEYRTPDNTFYNDLKENMMNGYPALISISKSETSLAHALVVDGYNTEGFFHLNYGWGDYSPANITDVWYLVPHNLGAGYDVLAGATMDIKPFISEISDLSINNKNIIFSGCRIGEKSNIERCTIKNIETDPVQIDYVITTDNFFIGNSTENLTDSLGSFLINSNDSLVLYLQCIPESGRLIQGNMIISFANHTKYASINLTGHGIAENGSIINNNFVSGIWNKDNSPYYICQDISIREYNKLEIEPGTKIIFHGPYQLQISSNAQLIANGNKSDSIYFVSHEKEIGWEGLCFESTSNDDTISYCVITGINSSLSKPAININRSAPVISHSCIHGNKGGNGIITFDHSAGIINQTRIERNISLSRSIIQINSTLNHTRRGRKGQSPLITNTLICNNTSQINGVLRVSFSSPKLVNVTISHNNTLHRGFAGTIALYGSENSIEFMNSIVMANKTVYGNRLIAYSLYQDTVLFQYSNVDTNAILWAQNTARATNLIWGEGNICQDPLFKNPEQSDFTLSENSPCIDMGNPDVIYCDIYDPYQPGYALWPASGTCLNDIGAYGGGRSGVLSNTNLIPDNFSIIQNFPNPFNLSTTIEFHIPSRDQVKIIVYNILGQKVRQLFNKKVDPGKYKVIWNGKNDHGIKVSSGIYFYFIRAGRFTKAQKMILLK